MADNRHFPVPPLSADSVLLTLNDLSAPQFELLLAEVRSPDGLRSTKVRCERLAKSLDVTPLRVRELLSVLHQFYTYTNPLKPNEELTPPPSIEDLLSSLEHLPNHPEAATLLPAILVRLTELVRRNPNVDTHRKVNRLREGFVKNALSFASLVDLRPDFSEDRDRIERLVPVIQVRITTDGNAERDKLIVFQLTLQKLKELEDMAKDVRAKLASISDGRPELALLVYKDTDESEAASP